MRGETEPWWDCWDWWVATAISFFFRFCQSKPCHMARRWMAELIAVFFAESSGNTWSRIFQCDFFFQNFLPVVALHFQAFDIADIVHKFPLDHINPDHGNGIACSFVCLNRWSPTDLPIIRQAGFQFPISAECTFHQNFYHLFFASTFLPLVLWVKISTTCTLRQNFYPLYFASKFLPLVLSCTLYQHADTYAFL